MRLQMKVTLYQDEIHTLLKMMWQHLHLVEMLPASQPNFGWIKSQKLWRWLWVGIIAMVRMTPILATLSLVSKEGKCGRGACDPTKPDHGEQNTGHSKAQFVAQFVHGSKYICTVEQCITAHGVHFTTRSTHMHRKAVCTLVLQCWMRGEGGKAGGRSEWNADAPFLDDIHALRLDHYNPLTYIFIVMEFKDN